MITQGSIVELKTENATYSPCKVVSMSKTSISVEYSAGLKRDGETGKFRSDKRTENIPMRDVVSLQERL